jgi:hypothetical protein
LRAASFVGDEIVFFLSIVDQDGCCTSRVQGVLDLSHRALSRDKSGRQGYPRQQVHIEPPSQAPNFTNSRSLRQANAWPSQHPLLHQTQLRAETLRELCRGNSSVARDTFSFPDRPSSMLIGRAMPPRLRALSDADCSEKGPPDVEALPLEKIEGEPRPVKISLE